MKKSIVKRIGSLLTVLLLTASIFSNGLVAFAADTKHTQSKVLDWSYNFEGSGLKNAYDPLTGGNTNDAFRYKWAQEFYFWNDESGNNCYCVQLGTEHDNNIVMSSSTFDDEGIKKYYKDVDQRKNLKVATIFAYKGKTKYGYNADTERVASQAMIWTVSGGFFDSSSENLSSDENTILNRIYAPSSADHKNLVDCYKKMKGDILNYYKIPAGATTAVRTAPTYELKYNTSTKKYEGTIKADSSISQFDFSKVDGVTFKKDGSNIKVSANENIKAGTKTVTLTKARAKNSGKIEECVPLFYKGKNDSGSQAKVGYMSGKDPVQAYFKLKIDMPTGNADLEKNFIDFFGNEETNVADKLKAVKFNLVMKNGDSDLFIKATGSDGKYTFSSTVSQANATDMTLDADGNIHVSGLPQGSYYWKETTTANGYALKTKTDVTVEANKTSKTVVDNQRTSVDKGELVIYKTDESGKKYLSGAKFEITAAEDIVVSGGITIRKKGDIIDTVTTDENGKAVITKDIYQGYSYTVTEIEAPKGYSLNSEPQTVKLATDTADFGSEVSVKNSPWTAPFIITKKNLGGELLPNCEFEILDENKRQITTGITDENGIATFSLGYGKYFYHEIAAPEKYIIDDTLYPFEITEEGVSVYAEMTNYLKEGSIKVTKTTTGNLNVKDIGFIVKGISDTNSDIERELFTDENGEALFENLPIGKYTVTEDGSTVPTAYLVADEQKVTVEYNETAEVPFENIEKTGSITVHKTTEGQKNIEGIKFYLRGTSDSGRAIDIPATTDKDGIAKFDGVPIGTYMVIEDEETVPYGYLVADEKEVKVEYAQTIDETILNNEQTGTVKVHKKTADMTNVEGIRFILSGISDTGREIRIEATTDKDGLAKFEGVPVGTYTITEDGSTVPYGYLVADSKQVTVAYAQTVDTDMVNEKAPDTPNTGVTDNDSDGSKALCSVAIILAGAAIVMFSRKRKER